MIRQTIILAKFSTVLKNKVGCIITDKKDNIISMGVNSDTKTHPMQKKFAIKSGQMFRQYLHAEIQALVRCVGNYSTPHTLYVARITQSGNIGMSKPCPVCHLALIDAGIKKVVYTIGKGDCYNEFFIEDIK